MNLMDRTQIKWKLRRTKSRIFTRRNINKFFLVGLIASLMSFFMPGISILRLISLVCFTLGVIGLLT